MHGDAHGRLGRLLGGIQLHRGKNHDGNLRGRQQQQHECLGCGHADGELTLIVSNGSPCTVIVTFTPSGTTKFTDTLSVQGTGVGTGAPTYTASRAMTGH
jgi:hypothetical protein